MNIIISNSSDVPIYEQIATQIKSSIISGELVEGDSLPSMRTLAKDLRISLITTKRAYQELEHDGFIESFTGKGSFVCRQNLNLIREECLKDIENKLYSAIQSAEKINLPLDEIIDMLRALYETK